MNHEFLDFCVYPVAAGLLIAFLLALLKIAFGGGGKIHGQTVSRLLEIIETNRDDLRALDAKVERQARTQRLQMKEIQLQKEEIHTLRVSLVNWQLFYQDLVVRWDIHRENPAPPDPPKEDER